MIQHQKKSSTVVVELAGELDHREAARLKPEIDALLSDTKIKLLVFDMKTLSFMDSSGIGMIIGRYKAMQRRGGAVAVRNCNRQVDKLIEMAGLYQIIQKLA